jgi:hypothetical protein
MLVDAVLCFHRPITPNAKLRSGRRACFIEKPVTYAPQELRKLIDLEKQHPGKLHGRYMPVTTWIPAMQGKLDSDNRKIEYLRFRDIILEGDYYIDQTLPIHSQ